MKYDLSYQNGVLRTSKDKWRIKMHNQAKKFCRGKIIELGCGFNPMFKNSVKVDLVPFNSAKNMIVADLNKRFPFRDDTFDTVVAMDLIEHLFNLDNFLN